MLRKLAEQYTKEQQDTAVIDGETADTGTNVLESTVEAIESEENLPLSLVYINEKIIQGSSPEEVKLDPLVQQHGVIEVNDDSQKSFTEAIINIPG